MILRGQPTIADIDELIGNLETGMDTFSAYIGISPMKYSAVHSNPIIQKAPGLSMIFLSEIWAGFLEYCKSNDLNPAQQVREAVASSYRDTLKMYRFRARQTLNNLPSLV
ncbi:MAG: hypothetical protein ACRD5H_15365 [Nitrososphaerales archaeon]